MTMASGNGARYRPRLARAALAGTGYAGALAVLDAVVHSRPDAGTILSWLSTDQDGLRHHPVTALLGSAFVTEDGTGWQWLPFAALAVSAAAWLAGVRRALAGLFAVHVLATLVSQSVLAVRVHEGLAPDAARHALDVGPSYVVVAGLCAAIAWPAAPIALRAGCAVALAVLAPSLLAGLTRWDLAPIGHLVSAVLATVPVRIAVVRCGVLTHSGHGRSRSPG